jgi:hypothetical protein
MRQKAVLKRATHCSTQHDNERLGKLFALMASAGKSKTMAGVFAVASNNFMTECHDLEALEDSENEGWSNVDEERTDDNNGDKEERTADPTESADAPRMRK